MPSGCPKVDKRESKIETEASRQGGQPHNDRSNSSDQKDRAEVSQDRAELLGRSLPPDG
jgi:hypothetical protein